MYQRILVPLEHSDADETILAHVRELARSCEARLVLIHVADGGWREHRPLDCASRRRCATTDATSMRSRPASGGTE
jgi:nucleotide-binding universal stress UspA family protein